MLTLLLLVLRGKHGKNLAALVLSTFLLWAVALVVAQVLLAQHQPQQGAVGVGHQDNILPSIQHGWYRVRYLFPLVSAAQAVLL